MIFGRNGWWKIKNFFFGYKGKGNKTETRKQKQKKEKKSPKKDNNQPLG